MDCVSMLMHTELEVDLKQPGEIRFKCEHEMLLQLKCWPSAGSTILGGCGN